MPTKLTPATIKILRGVVSKLTHECVDWYADDEPTLNEMTAEEVEGFVRDFLRRPEFYTGESL